MTLPNSVADRAVQENFDALTLGASGPNERVTSDGAKGLRMIRGIVDTAGSITEGTGFTLTRNSVGDVTITFTTAFSDVPAVTAMYGSGAFTAFVQTTTGGILAASARLNLIRYSTGTVADGPIHFIAIGP